MVTWWAVLRFAHVIFAVIWVGGQLTLSLLMLPLLRKRLPAELRSSVMTSIGKRFGIFTLALFVPVQVGTGIGLAIRHGVTWESLGEPGYGRTLATKLGVFVLVMIVAGLHGWAQAGGRVAVARTLALTSLTGSVVIVLLAAALAAL